VAHFGLEPHPGGRISTRNLSVRQLVHDALTGETRAASTAIRSCYAGLVFRVPPTPLRRSLALYGGDPITLHLLRDNGDLQHARVGPDPRKRSSRGRLAGRRRAAGRGSRCSAARLHRLRVRGFELGSREGLVAAFADQPGGDRGVYEGSH